MNTVTQEDIGMFQDMFSKLSNILVQASDIGQKLPALEAQIAQLTADCDSVRQKNISLDEMLAVTRSQRDEAKDSLEKYKTDNNAYKQQIVDLEYACEQTKGNLEARKLELEQAQKDRDEYGMKNLELADQLDKAKETITKFRELLGPWQVPTPLPAPPPVLASPATEPVGVTGDTQAGSDPVVEEVKPTTKRQWYKDKGTMPNHEYWANYDSTAPEFRGYDATVEDYYYTIAA